MAIKYIEGDLFNHSFTEGKITFLTHVNNDKGGWGRGFVIPLAKYCPEAERRYLSWHKEGEDRGKPFELGQTQLVNATTMSKGGLWVCNMVAQTLGTKRPLFYDKLVDCMRVVKRAAENSIENGYSVEIIAPLFGSQLAKGNWDFIEELIVDIWEDIDVSIYYLNPSFLTERLRDQLFPPKYLVRPSDFMIFEWLPEHQCYEISDRKVVDNVLPRPEYTYDLLHGKHKFFSIQEDEIEHYKDLMDKHYKELGEQNRRDRGCGDYGEE